MADDPAVVKPGTEASNLRASVQWIIATAGAVIAVVIARIPQASLTDLSAPGVALTLICLVAAAALAGTVLHLAARVLTVAHMPASQIATREQSQRARLDGDLQPAPELAATVVTATASELLGSFESLDDALRVKRRIHARLMEVAGAVPAEERELLLAQVADIDKRLADVRAAVQYDTALARHQTLLRRLPWLGGGLLACLVVYALTPTLLGANRSTITTPVPVAVTITDPSAVGMSSACPQTRTGVAVGGSRQAPVVVVEPIAGCPALTFTVRDGMGLTWLAK